MFALLFLNIVLAAAAPFSKEECEPFITDNPTLFKIYTYQVGDQYITDTIHAYSYTCDDIQKTSRASYGSAPGWQDFTIKNAGGVDSVEALDLDFKLRCNSLFFVEASGSSNGTALCYPFRESLDLDCVFNGTSVLVRAWRGCEGNIPYARVGDP